jgi:hypothetical protein
MEYSKLVAVTGLPGLFELINSKTDGAIVRSLDDKSTKFVSSRIHNFSQLESIEVYTVRENVNLAEILLAMQKEGGKLPDDKDPKSIRKYFDKVYPDLDFDRVYNSDLKKMVKWFEVLKNNNIEIKLPEPEPEEEEQEAAPEPEEKKVKKPKAAKEAEEEKPAKKVAVKEKKEEAKPAKKTAEKKPAPKKK